METKKFPLYVAGNIEFHKDTRELEIYYFRLSRPPAIFKLNESIKTLTQFAYDYSFIDHIRMSNSLEIEDVHEAICLVRQFLYNAQAEKEVIDDEL